MGFLDGDQYAELAKQLGATVVHAREQPSLLRDGVPEQPSLLRDGVRITIRKIIVEAPYSGEQAPSYRFHADLPPPGVPRFRLYPEGFKSFISKAFGGQDLELGNYALDLRFMVKARTPEVVKQLWTPELCDRFVALGDVTIEGNDREITLEQGFELGHGEPPVGGCELLWALAKVDLYGRDVLRALPEARFHRELGEVSLPGPNTIRMGFVRTDESVSIRARMRVEHDLELTDAIKRQFELVNAHVERVDEDVVVVWQDTERSPERLLRGVDLMRQLAHAPADGIFR